MLHLKVKNFWILMHIVALSKIDAFRVMSVSEQMAVMIADIIHPAVDVSLF